MRKKRPFYGARQILAGLIAVSCLQLSPSLRIKAEDVQSPFIIDGAKTAEENIKASKLGNGNIAVDGPGASSSFSGEAWQDNGNIEVVQDDSGLLDSDYLFKFYLHDSKDYDGSNTDRQRIELKGYNKSSEDVLAVEDDIITYNWKFKLPENLVDTPPAGFFHIFQIKAIDGGEAGAPIFTFTVTKDELLFRNVRIGADMSTIDVIDRMDIRSALGKWLEADVTIHYRDNGYVSMTLTDVASGSTVMSGSGSYDCWRRPEYKLSNGSWAEGDDDAPVTQRARPKWGLYRSIGKQGSGIPVADATMWFGDLTITKRDKSTYLFDDGYDPNDAGPVPNRKPETNTWTDGLEWTDDDATTNIKAGYANGRSVANLFDGTTSYWAPGKGLSGVADKQQLWVAVDLGQERPINQVLLSFGGGYDPRRLKNVTMAYTSNADAFDELVSGNNGTPYPFKTENGSAWTSFLETSGSPSKDKTYTVDEITARYVILVADAYNAADLPVNAGSTKIVSWLLSYEPTAAQPLKIDIQSPMDGEELQGEFYIAGEISNVLDFKKLSVVEVYDENGEFVASCTPTAVEGDETKAEFSALIPAAVAAGEHKFTVSISEPSSIGSTRIDKAAVTVTIVKDDGDDGGDNGGNHNHYYDEDDDDDDGDAINEEAASDRASSTTIVVVDPNRAPTILEGKEAQTMSASAGRAVYFSVRAANAKQYQWYVKRSGERTFAAIPGATKADYTISAAAAADHGNQYYCVITNKNGSSTSAVFTLEISGVSKVSASSSTAAPSKSDSEFNPSTGAL